MDFSSHIFYLLLFFTVIMLVVQIYIITGLMRVHEIATNIDRVVALLAAVASKMGVTSDDVRKAWGTERARTPEPQKEPEKEEPVKEEKEPTREEKKPVKVEKEPTKEGKKPVKVEKEPTREEKKPVKVEKEPTREEKKPMKGEEEKKKKKKQGKKKK